jgi:hypothetical protein
MQSEKPINGHEFTAQVQEIVLKRNFQAVPGAYNRCIYTNGKTGDWLGTIQFEMTDPQVFMAMLHDLIAFAQGNFGGVTPVPQAALDALDRARLSRLGRR